MRHVVLLLSFVLLAAAGGIPHTPTIKTPTPPRTPTPPLLIAPAVERYIVLLQHGTPFNDTVSVPVWERLDTTPPLPALVAADDFTIPLVIQSCRGIVADLVLLRQLGRESNYNVPVNITFWLFAANQLTGPFNRTRALVERSFVVPSEGLWDPIDSTGGTTVDHGAGNYYHIERLRFELTNLTLRSNTTYWLAALVATARNFSTVDYSQNLVRWVVSEANITTNSYRVVDWHGNMYRDLAALVNWTSAEVAEPTILPYFTSLSIQQSRTRQLALDVYGTGCVNLTRLPVTVKSLLQLPVREANAPSPTFVPPPSLDLTATPSLDPLPVGPVGPPAPPVSPSPLESVTPGLTPTPVTKAPPPPVTPPSSIVVSKATVPSSALKTPTPVPAWIPFSVSEPAAIHQEERISTTMWIIVGAGTLVCIALVVGFLILLMRCRNHTHYAQVPYSDYKKDQEDAVELSSVEEEEAPTSPKYMDAPSILADDDTLEPTVPLDPSSPTSVEEARANMDIKLMRKVKQ